MPLIVAQRGLATGLNHDKKAGARWRDSHRERLHFLANDKSTTYTSVLTPIGTTGEAQVQSFRLKDLGEYYMDAKLAGGHWQCNWDDGTCKEMEDEIEFAEKDASERSNQFKYVFDVSLDPLCHQIPSIPVCQSGGPSLMSQTDGNAWSSRFPRLMAANK